MLDGKHSTAPICSLKKTSGDAAVNAQMCGECAGHSQAAATFDSNDVETCLQLAKTTHSL